MVRGLYTAYTGMLNEEKRLDIISNNLANANTVGYKQESVTSQAFQQMLTIKIRDGSNAYVDEGIGKMSLGVKIGETYTDYGQGSMRQTGNTYDLAISGKGFFQIAVKDSKGNETTEYTRNGNFKITKDGYVVDTEGNHRIGSSGYIQVPTNVSDIAIGTDGRVYADGTVIDQIQLVDFADYDYLEKTNDIRYRAVDGATITDATGLIEQGYTEQSNVEAVTEMVDMIAITRAYESGQKVINTIDDMLSKATGQVGKV